MQEEIVYQFGAKINPEDLAELFKKTTWADGRSAEKITVMLRNTPIHLSAWNKGRIVGFLRAISDDVYRAVLDDLIVCEDFRRQGIGTEMVKRMLRRLEHLEEVSLDCETDLLSYYEKFGFLPDQFNCLRMWRRK